MPRVKKRKLSKEQKKYFGKRDQSVRRVSVESPVAFMQSMAVLRRGGLRTAEKKALIMAQNRALAQLNRKDLSNKERGEFATIARFKLPPVTRRKKRR